MAFARFPIFLFLILQIHTQIIHSQQANLMNGSTNGQNGLNQVFQGNPGTKATSENFIQNGSFATGISSQVPIKFQSLAPQSSSSMPMTSTVSLQNQQNHVVNSQPIGLQYQVPNFQQATIVQPSSQLADTSFATQSLIPQSNVQQQQNIPQPQNVYKIPLKIQQAPANKQISAQQPISFGDYNVQQQLPITSSIQQIPKQTSPSISIPNTAFLSSYPSVSAVSNYANQPTEYINNFAGNYLTPSASYSIIETPQVATSYLTPPYMAALPSPSSIPLVTNSVIPYANQVSDVILSPLRISNDFFVEDRMKTTHQDNLTSLLFSLLQSPKKSIQDSGHPGNPYPAIFAKEESKPSSLKSLIPLLFDLIKDRRDNCACCRNCQNCEQRKKNKKNTESELYNDYLNRELQRDYRELFRRDESIEEDSRSIRGYRKQKKINNSIPIESFEDDADYDNYSSEEED